MLALPFDYPVMEARRKDVLPQSPGWQYEPKWDGFRCLIFKDGEEIEMRSKSGKDLARYFPEIKELVKKLPAKTFVIDGELVIPQEVGFSFDALLQRIHPAASRIKKLSTETPAKLILFDILINEEGTLVAERPLKERRIELIKFAKANCDATDSANFSTTTNSNNQIILSPASEDVEITNQWKSDFNGKLDGLIAKNIDLPYQSGNRNGMVKYKWMRTADCVIGGFRYEKDENYIGSLLLGLYDKENQLVHIGFCSSFSVEEKKELTKLLETAVTKKSFETVSLDAPSRWQHGEKKEWVPVGGDLVAEFSYDHFSDGRFRHGTKLLRWRPDKSPQQCTFDQIK